MKQFSRMGIFAAMAMSLVVGCGGSDSSTPPTPTPTDSAQQRTPQAVDSSVHEKGLFTPVSGTVDGARFSGTLKIDRFVAQNDHIVAIGSITNLTGDLSEVATAALETEEFQFAVAFPQRYQQQQHTNTDGNVATVSEALTCDILLLELGPLDLNLLGLVIHLDQVVLDIVAETGAGNLLGNLLCALTSLLDPVAFLQNILQIVAILNQIIALLGSL